MKSDLFSILDESLSELFCVAMMTSSNWNIFRVTGHLCGEFTGLRWIPRKKGQWRGALMFSLIPVWINGWVNNREAGDLKRDRAHYDVTLMQCTVYGKFQLASTKFALPIKMLSMMRYVINNLANNNTSHCSFSYSIYTQNTPSYRIGIHLYLSLVCGAQSTSNAIQPGNAASINLIGWVRDWNTIKTRHSETNKTGMMNLPKCWWLSLCEFRMKLQMMCDFLFGFVYCTTVGGVCSLWLFDIVFLILLMILDFI